MKPTAIAVVLVLLCAARPAYAAAPDREQIERAQAAYREALTLLKAKKYDESVAKFKLVTAAISNHPVVNYNFACALSLSGQKDAALDALEKSIRAGYVDHAHMQADPDLVPIRDSDRFKALIALAKEKAKPKPPLIHIPDGYQKEPDTAYPLFVALHGAGGTPTGLFQAAKQILGPDAFFILAPYGSARVGPGHTWNSTDLKTIADLIAGLRKTHRIRRVYLFGFSAGAHIGYVFVLKSPGVFDGFIPMAGALRRRWLTPGDLQNAKGLPIYAIQGKIDAVVPLRAAEQSLDLLKKHGAVTHLFTHPGAHRAPKNFRKALLDAVKWLDAHQPAAGEAAPAGPPGRLDSAPAAD